MIDHELDRIIDELLQWCGKTHKDKRKLQQFAFEIRNIGFRDGYDEGYFDAYELKDDDRAGIYYYVSA